MYILKFGGTSVNDAGSIQKTIDIIKHKKGKKIVVVSAFGGVTNSLLNAITCAIKKDKNYGNIIAEIKERHLKTLSELLPDSASETMQNKIKDSFLEIERLLNGCYLLGEISSKSQAKILSYGEILSSCILYEKLQSDHADCFNHQANDSHGGAGCRAGHERSSHHHPRRC